MQYADNYLWKCPNDASHTIIHAYTHANIPWDSSVWQESSAVECIKANKRKASLRCCACTTKPVGVCLKLRQQSNYIYPYNIHIYTFDCIHTNIIYMYACICISERHKQSFDSENLLVLLRGVLTLGVFFATIHIHIVILAYTGLLMAGPLLHASLHYSRIISNSTHFSHRLHLNWSIKSKSFLQMHISVRVWKKIANCWDSPVTYTQWCTS